MGFIEKARVRHFMTYETRLRRRFPPSHSAGAKCFGWQARFELTLILLGTNQVRRSALGALRSPTHIRQSLSRHGRRRVDPVQREAVNHHVTLNGSTRFPKQKYKGQTTNLKARLADHNLDHSPYTKLFLPWELVAYLAFRDKTKAIDFERYLKSGSGHAFSNKRLWGSSGRRGALRVAGPLRLNISAGWHRQGPAECVGCPPKPNAYLAVTLTSWAKEGGSRPGRGCYSPPNPHWQHWISQAKIHRSNHQPPSSIGRP